MESGNAAEGCGAADAVLTEPVRGIAACIKPRYDLAAQVDGLRAGVDPDARGPVSTTPRRTAA